MSYESLERELARRQSQRQSRRSKGDKKAKRKYSPYRRGGRKGSKARTQLAEGEDKLGKALAAARERAAKYAKPRLNITKLPDREQLSLKDFEERSAEIFRAKKGGKEKAKAAESFNAEYPLTVERYDVVIYRNEVDEYKFANKVGGGRTTNLRRSRLVARDERELLDIINELIQSEIEDVPTYEASNFEFYHKDYSEEWNKSIISTDVLAIWDGEEGVYFYPTEDEIEQWRNGNQEIYTLNFVFDLAAETFNAESFDETIVVEGYKPKRVEAWLSAGNVAIFYVGDRTELRYTHPMSRYQERTLLPSPLQTGQSGQSIINPTGITLADVDELMQVSTGEPWNGKYVLYTDEGNFLFYEPKNFMAETKKPRKRRGITRFGKQPSLSLKNIRKYNRQPSLQAESEEFRAEPAMYVKCFECEKPGYSDEMSKIAFGYLCARCARPEIDWDAYSAESGLNDTHRGILIYLSQFNPELVHRKYGIPTGMTQREIGKAVGTVRTNATRHLQDLIGLGLVVQIMRRPDGASRIAKVYLPTYEGQKIAQSFRAEDLNGNGVIDTWETHAHENTLTGLAHEESYSGETFRANLRKTNLKPNQIREKAQEAFEGVAGWMWLSELTGKINSTLSTRQRIAPGVVSRAIGTSKGGHHGFYVTLDKRIFYYGDKDRGEFIKGVI